MPVIGYAHWLSDAPSGGNRYDEELLARLPDSGPSVRPYRVRGTWPVPTREEAAAFDELLGREPAWLVDNIVASAAPAAIAGAVRAGRRIAVLVHYFPADDPSLTAGQRTELAEGERRVVAAAHTVIVTSHWAAAEVARRYGRADAVVAPPGVDPAPLSPGSAEGTHLFWLARLTAGKDPVTFLRALSRLRDLEWRATLAGPAGLDPEVTAEVQRLIRRWGLTDRVQVPGALRGAELEGAWAQADLLVHTSLAETYGMVVAEACARGIASVVAAGTGAVEAQAGGEAFPAGDADALAEVLRTWLTDERVRRRWRETTLARRPTLQTWADTAERVWSAARA